jgi:hypothetical protein
MISNIFATPVCFDTFESYDRKDELTTEFLLVEEEEHSVIDNNDLFEQDLPELHRFRDNFIKPAFDRYLTEVYGITMGRSMLKSWAYKNKNNEKDWGMQYHNHAGSHFSAVFYILVEDKKDGGDLLLHDPRTNANRGYNARKELIKDFDSKIIKPKSFDYTIFPSYLFHSVRTIGDKLRMSLPVDLTLDWEM